MGARGDARQKCLESFLSYRPPVISQSGRRLRLGLQGRRQQCAAPQDGGCPPPWCRYSRKESGSLSCSLRGAQDSEQPSNETRGCEADSRAWGPAGRHPASLASGSLSPRPVHTAFLACGLSTQFPVSGHWETPALPRVPLKRVSIMGLAESLKAEWCPVCH